MTYLPSEVSTRSDLSSKLSSKKSSHDKMVIKETLLTPYTENKVINTLEVVYALLTSKLYTKIKLKNMIFL